MDIHELTRELHIKNDAKIVMLVADGLGGLPISPGGKTELESDNDKWLRISWGSGIGAVAMSILAIRLYEYSAIFLVLSLLALITLLVAYIKRSRYWRDSGIASYDGQYFTFNNNDFHEKFAKLNPTLVKKE